MHVYSQSTRTQHRINVTTTNFGPVLLLDREKGLVNTNRIIMHIHGYKLIIYISM